MFDFRLKVFYTVAKRLNFTKAAEELFISQPAVTKHIHEIENHYNVRLFERNGTKIKLTEVGQTLLNYCDEIFAVYNRLNFELNNISKQHNGTIRIGASTTVADYILPLLLASFYKKFKDVKIILLINNTEFIEDALASNNIDLGIIEGYSKKSIFKYTEFVKDELVLVKSTTNNLHSGNSITASDLLKIPLLLREPGSGTLEVIAHALKSNNIKLSDLNIEMQLGSTESIKLYLLNSDTMAFLSIYSIIKELKRNELNIVDINELEIGRNLYFIQKHGEGNSLPDLFMNFAASYNFGL